ncbi:MAG: hypothetical protein JNK64_15965 [Myxococcales bacterium]|nr:hypothetical protein [Myxococcales bacterium]
MRGTRLLLIATTAVVAPSATARADGWATAPRTLEAQLGLASPLGVGVAVDVAPVRWLSVGAGVGRSATAVQVAGCVRARPWAGPHRALYLGACASAGRYREPTSSDATYREAARAYWASPEIGVEWRGDHVAARIFAGPTFLLNPDAVHCTGASIAACEEGETWGTAMPFGGVAIGWAF